MGALLYSVQHLFFPLADLPWLAVAPYPPPDLSDRGNCPARVNSTVISFGPDFLGHRIGLIEVSRTGDR